MKTPPSAAPPASPQPAAPATTHRPIGSRSVALPVDTGVSHLATYETDTQRLASLRELSLADLPAYEITGCKDASGNPVVYHTSDPGKGPISGRCADLNRFKVPTLHGLPSRAPYFHNGAAQTIGELIDFYDTRFAMNLTATQKTDLTNFLNAL